jgi:glutamyl-tRNA synthetase
MTGKVRFAPSPTGLLHVGNARVAVANALFAKKTGASFLLRLDDTDLERSKPEYAQAIERDLAWLGISWDEKLRQSDRLALYEEAASRLKASGRLYPCYETAQELDLKRKVQLSRGRPPVYDRAALNLSEADRAKLESEGKRPHWRFKLDTVDISWEDLARGPSHYHGAHLSDPVLIREDGSFLYTLTSVVDDADLGVSHVIRGEDHVVNTAVQIQLFAALGTNPPAFAHLPLLLDADGGKLSKRLGGLTVESLRDDGLEPFSIASYLSRLGTRDAIEPFLSFESMAEGFDFGHVSHSPPRFSDEELKHLNAKLLHKMPFEQAKAQRPDLDQELWEAARPNLEKLGDIDLWQQVCRGEVLSKSDEPDFLTQAASLLPPLPWDLTTWSTWTQSVTAASGRKGKQLFLPLRQALTGLDHGPEMKTLLPLIGRELALHRLNGGK